MHEIGVKENSWEQAIDLSAFDWGVVVASVVLSCWDFDLQQVGGVLVDALAEFEDEDRYICKDDEGGEGEELEIGA